VWSCKVVRGGAKEKGDSIVRESKSCRASERERERDFEGMKRVENLMIGELYVPKGPGGGVSDVAPHICV